MFDFLQYRNQLSIDVEVYGWWMELLWLEEGKVKYWMQLAGVLPVLVNKVSYLFIAVKYCRTRIRNLTNS